MWEVWKVKKKVGGGKKGVSKGRGSCCSPPFSHALRWPSRRRCTVSPAPHPAQVSERYPDAAGVLITAGEEGAAYCFNVTGSGGSSGTGSQFSGFVPTFKVRVLGLGTRFTLHAVFSRMLFAIPCYSPSLDVGRYPCLTRREPATRSRPASCTRLLRWGLRGGCGVDVAILQTWL